MRTLGWLLLFAFILSSNGLLYSEEVEREEKSGGGGEALTGAIMGGLLGAGVGAAIGSASGKAGQGAAIGAGVGAVGGTLLGANQASQRAKEDSDIEEPETTKPPKNMKIKKRIIREYDEEGNVISEKEVKN